MNAKGWRSFRWDGVIDAISFPLGNGVDALIMLQATEVIKDKYWIVNSKDGRKVGTLRAMESGFEFDSRTNTKELFDSIDSFKVSEKESVKDNNVLVNGYPTGVPEPVAVDHDTLPAFTKTKTAKQVFALGYYIVKFDGMGWQWAFAHL